MEHIGGHLHQTHVDTISFGIDQILNNADQGSCMISNPRMQDLDYGLGSIVSTAYNTMTGNYNGNNTGGYNGNACSMGSLNNTYNMNMNMSVNGNGLNSSGVIRVPAHRPLSSVHSSITTNGASVPSMANMATINNLTGLTFPWMESNRRYTKDRFTGRFKIMSSILITLWKWNLLVRFRMFLRSVLVVFNCAFCKVRKANDQLK